MNRLKCDGMVEVKVIASKVIYFQEEQMEFR